MIPDPGCFIGQLHPQLVYFLVILEYGTSFEVQSDLQQNELRTPLEPFFEMRTTLRTNHYLPLMTWYQFQLDARLGSAVHSLDGIEMDDHLAIDAKKVCWIHG